jgi:hypothetical protein
MKFQKITSWIWALNCRLRVVCCCSLCNFIKLKLFQFSYWTCKNTFTYIIYSNLKTWTNFVTNLLLQISLYYWWKKLVTVLENLIVQRNWGKGQILLSSKSLCVSDWHILISLHAGVVEWSSIPHTYWSRIYKWCRDIPLVQLTFGVFMYILTFFNIK